MEAAWPFFEPRHRDLVARLAQWLPATPSDGDDAARLLARLAESGMLAAAIPDADDPVDCRALFLIREHLARYDPQSDAVLVAQAMGAMPLRAAPPQQDRLAAARQGAWRVGLAEPVGARPAAAEPDGDDFLVSGSLLLPFDGQADGYVVLAGPPPLSAFVIERDIEGFGSEPADRGAAVRLERCRVPSSALIGGAGEGARIAVAVRELLGASAAAAAVGLARGVLDGLAERLADRALFGRRLLAYQEAQASLADLATRIEGADLVTYRAAWARDRDGGRMPRDTSMARLAAFDAVQAAIAQAETVLADRPAWLDSMQTQSQTLAAAYDRDVESLLLAGQTLTQMRPSVDGWRGRPRAGAVVKG